MSRTPSRNTILLRCLVAIVAAGILTSYAPAQVIAPVQQSIIAAASIPQPLPEAPSSVPPAASPAPVAAGAPLEQQPHPPVKVWETPFHMLNDGKHVAVAPIYLRSSDLKWLLPLAGAAAAAFATDQHTMTQVVSSNPSFNQTSVDVSDGLVFGMVALPASMFAAGEAKHDEHARETGILGGEAMSDALVVGEVVKLCAWRERPTVDNGRGEFFIGSAGANSSFISGHSIVAWSSAAVLAGEYPGKWMQFGVYTAAAGVSITRVLGQQHFPSDVLLGAAGGWLIGHYVFRAHHHWSQQQSRAVP